MTLPSAVPGRMLQSGLLLLCLLAGAVSAQTLQDPTRPSGFNSVAEPEDTEESHALGSIIIGPGRRIAVIDGQPRMEGQTFNGVRVLRITPGKVELRVDGEVKVLQLEALPTIRSSQ